MKVHIQIFFLFLFFASNAHLQNLNSYQAQKITDQEGLPSNEVYDIVEDQKGFIWFATDRGVSRYNGVSHEIYNSRNGLSGDAAYHLFKQSDTSIVCVNKIGAFYKIKNGQVHELIPSDSIKKYIGRTEFPFSYRQDSCGFYNIGTRTNHYTFDQKGKLIHQEGKKNHNTLYLSYSEGDEDAFCYFDRSLKHPDFNHFQVQLNDNLIFKEDVSIHYNHRSFYPSVYKGSILIPLEYSFLLVDSKGKVRTQQLNDRILSSYISEKNLFICTDNGLYVYNYNHQEIEISSYVLSGMSISSVLQTNKRKIWVSTIENGVFYYDLTQPQIINTKSENLNFSAFEYYKGNLLIGSYRGFLSTNKSSFQNKNKRKIFSITYVNGDFHILDGKVYDSPKNFRIDKPIKTKKGEDLYAWTLIEINDSTWITMLGNKITVFNHKSKKCLDTVIINEGIEDFLFFKSKIYIATNHRIEIFSLENMELNKTKILEAEKVYRLLSFKNDLCGITKDYRLFKLSSKNELVWLSLPQPKNFSLVTAAEASENMIHIGINNGVYSWRPLNDWTEAELIGFESVPNPILIKIKRDSLLFATKKNIYRKAINDLSYSLPKIYVDILDLDGRKIPNKGVIQLNHDFKVLSIPIEYTNFRSEPIFFRYLIKNLNNEFVFTKDPTLYLSTLPPGKYTIEIAASVDQVNFTSVEKVRVDVEYPFWQTKTFFLFSGLLLLILIGVTYYYFLNRVKRKNELNQLITKLKSQALAAQLNPHMVFNVLNSIQGLVSEGQKELANLFIARFSKFMRNTLKYSNQDYVSIGEEIKLTKQYIDIEKIRFGEEIHFIFNIGSIDRNNIIIPPLTLQPLIENSIKHGLMPSSSQDKVIQISISSNHLSTVIEISDNGIGFDLNYKFNTGMIVTERRIKLLNSKNQLIVKQIKNPTIVQILLVNDN